MRINTPALLTEHDALVGNDLKLAGQGFDMKKILKIASKASDIGIGPAGALGDDKTRERAQQAAADKTVLDGNGTPKIKISKAQGKKMKTAGKKAFDIGLALADEFGNEKTKKKAAKVRKAKEIITGAGSPGADLRAKLMRYHHGL
jgi:hypothetical protein